jgi:hypothetical protein
MSQISLKAFFEELTYELFWWNFSLGSEKMSLLKNFKLQWSCSVILLTAPNCFRIIFQIFSSWMLSYLPSNMANKNIIQIGIPLKIYFKFLLLHTYYYIDITWWIKYLPSLTLPFPKVFMYQTFHANNSACHGCGNAM